MEQLIYIVKGVRRHFTGDCEITIVGARKEERDAIKLGSTWAESENRWYHEQNLNIHVSYEVISVFLR